MPRAANAITDLPLGNRFTQCDDLSDDFMTRNDRATEVSRLTREDLFSILTTCRSYHMPEELCRSGRHRKPRP